MFFNTYVDRETYKYYTVKSIHTRSHTIQKQFDLEAEKICYMSQILHIEYDGLII